MEIKNWTQTHLLIQSMNYSDNLYYQTHLHVSLTCPFDIFL